MAKYLLSDLFNDNHLRLKLAAAPQHGGGEDQDHPVHRPARDGVHDLAVTLPIFGKTGDHGRLQTQDRHHGRNEVQHLGGEKDGAAQPAKLHQIDNGYGHGIKGIEGRQIEGAPRVGKTGVCPRHEDSHAGHGEIQQKEQPRRGAIAAAFQRRTPAAARKTA